MTSTPDRYRDRAKVLWHNLLGWDCGMEEAEKEAEIQVIVEALSSVAAEERAKALEEAAKVALRFQPSEAIKGTSLYDKGWGDACRHIASALRSLAKAPVSNGETKEGGGR